jgi:serine protease AprX
MIGKVSDELLHRVSSIRPVDRINVIIQPSDAPGLELSSFLKSLGAKETRRFNNFSIRAVSLPAQAVNALIGRNDIFYVSLDSEVRPLGHLSHTTGADAVRNQASGDTNYTLDGTSIGIAVLDSGVDPNHVAFNDSSAKSRIVLSKDFTGEGRTDDPYGHGTHVASVAAGNGSVAQGAYTGVAPNANLINLRVLNSRGVGSVSGVLAALDWVLANHAYYRIRVVNMSLGSSAVDTYQIDPLCQAVRHLVDAGIVVVAAAGNNGKDGSGRKVYGQVHAPGNEPSAVTVGASNTFATDARYDDAITTYSSRGPTRSYWTDAGGVRHYDNLFKPDLVAPGNKIIAAQAQDNFLVTQNPSLDSGLTTGSSKKQMSLNGTSVAAPSVAGAAALLLQANPRLTPNLVKAILMYTAQPLADYNMLEQGAGQLNIKGAVQVAKLVRADLNPELPVGAPLLVAGSQPNPQTTIAYHTFPWAEGVMADQAYARGADLITRYQKFYGTGMLLADGTTLSEGVLVRDPTVLSSGVIIGDAALTSTGAALGYGSFFLDSGQLLGGGILLQDGSVVPDGVIIGDKTLQESSDSIAQSVIINGDGVSSGP